MAGSIFVHDFSGHAPDCPVTCGAPAEGYDEALIQRIATALRKSMARTASTYADVWTSIIGRHQPFVDLIRAGHLPDADNLLANMFKSPLTFGFEQYDTMYDIIAGNPELHYPHVRMLAFDKLLSIAEWLRVIPVQTVEQGDFLPWLQQTPDALLDRIEAATHQEIRAPRFHGGLFGVDTSRGLFGERGFAAVYVALRIRELVRDLPHPPRICEIGGGAGYVAYYCHQFGIKDYTLVDLPTVNSVQAYFLAKNLGADHVILSGEAAAGGDGVKIISGDEFIDDVQPQFDLMVNVDSFPEMGGGIARQYLARGNFRRLLSINQEAMAPRHGDQHQERVGDLIDETGGLRRLSRNRCWLRPGYVEEVYEAAPKT